MIRIIIADDHHLVRQGIRSLLEKNADIQVLSEAADGQEAYDQIRKLRPDVAVLDIGMPRLNGTQVLERIRGDDVNTRVIFLSMYSDGALVRQALRAGARGYLLKNSVKEELYLAVQAAVRGELYLSPPVSEILVGDYLGGKPDGSSPADALTTREKEVLKLIAEGNTNVSIAGALQISVKTVEKHRASLLSKLKVRDTAGLIRAAIQQQLVFLEDRPD